MPVTVDLLLNSRLISGEWERKRKEKELRERALGSVSNLFTLIGKEDYATTIARVKYQVGLVALDRAYTDFSQKMPDAPVSRDTFGDFFTEYVDPGHLGRTFETAQAQPWWTPELADSTLRRFGGLTEIATHARERRVLPPEQYWELLSQAEQGAAPFDVAQQLALRVPISQQTVEDQRLMAPGASEAYIAKFGQRPEPRFDVLEAVAKGAEFFEEESLAPLGGRITKLGEAAGFVPGEWRFQKPSLAKLGEVLGMSTEEAREYLREQPMATQILAEMVIPLAPGEWARAGEAIKLITKPGVKLTREAVLEAVERAVPGARARIAAEAVPEVAPTVPKVAEAGEAARPLIDEAPLGKPRLDPPEPVPEQTVLTAEEIPSVAGGRSTSYAGELRPFDEIVEEVVTTDNPVVQALIAKTGISPSVAQDTVLGRSLVAYERQMVAADQLTEVALQAGLDRHTQMFTGRQPFLRIAKNENLKGVTPKPGAKSTSLHWEDVFSRPDDYVMPPELRAYVDDYLRIVDDAEALRVLNGLKPRGTRSTDGWFYVPRQVAEAHGITPRKPSNPNLMRHYEEAQEGVANGIRYGADPRETLRLHLRQSYREVIEQQLSEAVEPLSITAKEMLPEPVLRRMSDATTRRIAAERAMRRGPATPELSAELEAAMAEYKQAKVAYSAELKSAQKAEWAPGNLFGRQEEYIPITKWRNRFLPRDDYDKLTDALRFIVGRGPRANAIGRSFQVLGNTVRFLASVGDFAEPFVQGLLHLAYKPKVWARSTLRHYQAWADPSVQARMIKDHLATFQKMARHGTPIGDPEFFAAMRVGEGVPAGKLLEHAPGGAGLRQFLRQAGRQTFGRFQSSYNVGLGYSRALLTEAMETTWKGTEAELQATIRNLSGGLDSRALGVGPTQRGVESMWLGFSPRLMRSTFALVGDLRYGIFHPRGRVAYEALGKLAMGATGIYITTGLALGKSWEEILDGLNPLNGKKYMSHEINGQWIGIGGQVRAITQLMARSGADVYKTTKGARPDLTRFSMDNPLAQWYASRGAVGVTTAGAAAEAVTGLNVLPFENIDNLPDLAKHLGTAALPFTLQGILEGEAPWTVPFSLGGARVSKGTTWEATQKARDAEAVARGYEGWDDPKLDQPTKYQIDEAPEVAPLLEQLEREGEDWPQTPEGQYYKQVDTIREGQQAAQQGDDDFYTSEQIDPGEWRGRTADRNREVWAAMQQAQADFDITFEDRETTNPVDAAIQAYYAVEVEDYKDDAGRIMWDEFHGTRESALAALSATDREKVEDYIHRYWTPLQWEMFRKEQQLQEYLEIPETVFAANRDKPWLASAAPSYSAYRNEAMEEARQNAAAQGLPITAATHRRFQSPAYRRLQDLIIRERERYRRSPENRDKVDLILELGFKPWSKADIARAKAGTAPAFPAPQPVPLPEIGLELPEPIALPTGGLTLPTFEGR